MCILKQKIKNYTWPQQSNLSVRLSVRPFDCPLVRHIHCGGWPMLKWLFTWDWVLGWEMGTGLGAGNGMEWVGWLVGWLVSLSKHATLRRVPKNLADRWTHFHSHSLGPDSLGSLRSSSSPSLLVISIDRLCRLRFASFVHFSLNIAYLHSDRPPSPPRPLSIRLFVRPPKERRFQPCRVESSPSCQ